MDGQAATRVMQDQFSLLREHLSKMKAMLDTMQARNNHGAEVNPKFAHFKDGFFCFELALTFYEEANHVLQAGAWFAAVAIASSALEAMLLTKCLLQEDDVKKLPAFKTLQASYQKDYGKF